MADETCKEDLFLALIRVCVCVRVCAQVSVCACACVCAHMQSRAQLSYSYMQASEPLLTFCTLTTHFWFGNTVSCMAQSWKPKWGAERMKKGQRHIQERWSLVGSGGSVSPTSSKPEAHRLYCIHLNQGHRLLCTVGQGGHLANFLTRPL